MAEPVTLDRNTSAVLQSLAQSRPNLSFGNEGESVRDGHMNQSTPGAPRTPPFYGWWMVWLGGFLSSLNKTAINKGFPVFVAPVRDGFGTSNAAVAFIFSLARAQSGPTGLLAGWFIDRYGPRRAVLVGALLSGGGFLALGYTTSLWAFGVLYLLVVTTGPTSAFPMPWPL